MDEGFFPVVFFSFLFSFLKIWKFEFCTTMITDEFFYNVSKHMMEVILPALSGVSYHHMLGNIPTPFSRSCSLFHSQ